MARAAWDKAGSWRGPVKSFQARDQVQQHMGLRHYSYHKLPPPVINGRAALPPHIWLTLKCAMLGPARGQGPVYQWARGQWAPAEACQAKVQSWVTVLIFQSLGHVNICLIQKYHVFGDNKQGNQFPKLNIS